MNYQELKETVLKHGHFYYDLHQTQISDEEYDILYNKLEAVETAQGWADPDSPTIRVGHYAGKVRHPFPLFSLKKVYDIKEIDNEFNVVTPKLDGTNLTVIYQNGKFQMALTRGNGEYGDNVSHLVKYCKAVPKSIPSHYNTLIVTGECVTDNKVENFRNYVSGALGLKDPEEFKSRNISFIAHDSLGTKLDYTIRMNLIENLGFQSVFNQKLCEQYPQDGTVYRIDKWKRCQELGYTSKHPRFAIALKERGTLTATTSLQDVIWVIGRTGMVNPIGVIDPVEIDGAIIGRATLHNIGFIEQHKLGLGDIIEIERSGGVIPKFNRVLNHLHASTRIEQRHAEEAVGYTLRRVGPRLYCSDASQHDSVKGLEYFIRILEIKGLGPKSIAKLQLTHPTDLYRSQEWQTLGVNGQKIQAEIERSKTKPYHMVLAALGIPGVGRGTARRIVTHLPQFNRLREIELAQITGIGPKTVDSILAWLDVNEEWVTTLPLQLKQDQSVDAVLQSSGGKKLCVTGKLDVTRGELTEILSQFNYQVTSTVTKDCIALISADTQTKSSKMTKAQKFGIKIIDYWANRQNILNGKL
jgi:DNA ligase (NAD+)